MDLQPAGRRALVTGGSRGIGLACARALVREGASVALLARDGETAQRSAEALGVGPERAMAVAADTGDDASVLGAVAAVTARLGAIDILVNAAATPNTGGPIGEDRLEEEINVKVRGYLRCARAVAPMMVDAGWGRIVNISGLAARRTGSVVGSVRNVAVAALTKNLADELGPQGVNVTVVHPGMTRTERTPGAFAAMAAARGVTVDELERSIAADVSIGRIPTAEEVAEVVAFLASPLSVAINGDAVVASGGARGAIHY
jgi:NAD(P)-dependent dehydrogenase (short-subunit alcohol dehydrogenase family)